MTDILAAGCRKRDCAGVAAHRQTSRVHRGARAVRRATIKLRSGSAGGSCCPSYPSPPVRCSDLRVIFGILRDRRVVPNLPRSQVMRPDGTANQGGHHRCKPALLQHLPKYQGYYRRHTSPRSKGQLIAEPTETVKGVRKQSSVIVPAEAFPTHTEAPPLSDEPDSGNVIAPGTYGKSRVPTQPDRCWAGMDFGVSALRPPAHCSQINLKVPRSGADGAPLIDGIAAVWRVPDQASVIVPDLVAEPLFEATL